MRGGESVFSTAMARTAPRPDLITADEAAALLHLHVKRVQLLAREGKLPAVRHGRRWLFSRERLVEGRPGREAAQPSSDQRSIDISAILPQELVAVITRNSAERLGLVRGVEAVAVVKSTEIMIARRRG